MGRFEPYMDKLSKGAHLKKLLLFILCFALTILGHSTTAFACKGDSKSKSKVVSKNSAKKMARQIKKRNQKSVRTQIHKKKENSKIASLKPKYPRGEKYQDQFSNSPVEVIDSAGQTLEPQVTERESDFIDDSHLVNSEDGDRQFPPPDIDSAYTKL